VLSEQIAMQQLRELATSLEKQFDFLQVAGERERLEAENAAMQGQLEAEVKQGETTHPETDPADGEPAPSERREGLKVRTGAILVAGTGQEESDWWTRVDEWLAAGCTAPRVGVPGVRVVMARHPSDQ
jgi:hypothetical protein